MQIKSLSTLLLFFLILVSFSADAQSMKGGTYTAYVNYPDYNLKVEVANTQKEIHVKEELEYFWYSSNRIFKTKGGYDGKLLTGAYTSFYLSNNLKEKGTFSNGLKNGVWISWFENGQIHEKSSWKKGAVNGEHRTFNDSGELISRSSYRNGQLNGYQITYEKGKEIKKVKFRHGREVIKKERKPKSEKPGKNLKGKFKSLFNKNTKKDKSKDEVAPGQPEKQTEKKKEPVIKQKSKKKNSPEEQVPKKKKEHDPLVKKDLK